MYYKNGKILCARVLIGASKIEFSSPFPTKSLLQVSVGTSTFWSPCINNRIQRSFVQTNWKQIMNFVVFYVCLSCHQLVLWHEGMNKDNLVIYGFIFGSDVTFDWCRFCDIDTLSFFYYYFRSLCLLFKHLLLLL